MNLTWSRSSSDIFETANQVLLLCEARLTVLPPDQQSRSTEVLNNVRQQLGGDLSEIRRKPHMWGTQLANVAVRIAKRMPKRDPDERAVAKQLANYSGIVFEYRRNFDPAKYEDSFRLSLEVFLRAALPELIPTVIAADILDEVRDWLKSFYDKVPKDLAFLTNDIVLTYYESHRRELDTDEKHGLMVRFVEDNRDLISLSVSATSEVIRERWEALYRRHIGEPPPPPDKKLISAEVRGRLKKAVQTNDPMAVRDVLAPLETGLIKAVSGTLDVSFDFREPRREVRDYSRKPTADFETARRQIRQNSRKAVASFSNIWNNQVQNFYAMEWYAYALAKVEDGWRQAKDLFEQMRAADRGDQITDWNVACCEIKLGDRKAAFRMLRGRVESGTHFDDVLEPTIALALEFKDKRFLSQQLDWLPLEEAILLGYLFAADSQTPMEELEEWLPAVEVIASDPRGFDPPDPAEDLSIRDLNDLCFAFIRRRMVRGGISWFRGRVGFGEHKYFYLNWRLLGNLCLQARHFDEATRSYERMLECTNRAQISSEKKAQALEEVLNILLDQGLTTGARDLLAKYASMLPLPELSRWQQRMKPEEELQVPPLPLEPAPQQPEEKLPHPQDPQSRLMQINNRLLKLKRIEELKGDFSLLSNGADTLFEMWPAYSRKLVDQLRTAIGCLRDFESSSNLEEKEKLGVGLRESMAEINTVLQEISEAQLKENADDIITTLKRFAADASFQTSVMRNIEIEWHLNGYLPDRTLSQVSPELPKTSVLLRMWNRGTEPVKDVEVHLQSESGKVTVVESVQRLGMLLDPEASAVLRFPLEYDSLEGEETFLAFTKFSAGVVTNLQTPARRFSLRAQSFSELLGGADAIRDAFFVGVGIPEDRRDVFHGREREQARIANSLRGNVQSEVLFLNGPRRVGKTSILNSLKWALPALGLNEIITVSLSEEIPLTTGAFLRGVAAEVIKAVDKHLNVRGYLQLPPADEFESEPTVAFRDFCEVAKERLAPRRILLMLDETQRLAQAVKNGRIDENVLGLFSTLMSRNSGVMFVFTASVLFRNVKDLSPHPIWGRVAPFATGFLNADAINQILQAGVGAFPVKFTPEALDRVWRMTEGHPWVVQAIGKRIVNGVLNPQQRLTVGPPDVDQAVELIERTEDQYCYYWWNERPEEGGFVDQTDWEIAKLIIKEQEGPGIGVLKSVLFEKMGQRGQPINNERIRKLTEMQTLVKEMRDGEEWVRIKGLFLERWLRDQVDVRQAAGPHTRKLAANVALFVDHENVSISMQKFIEELPTSQKAAWKSVREPALLARRLAQHAERFGTLTHRVAVANWQLFVQDLSAYAQAMFSFDQPLGGKNTSDEKLKQLIRDALEQKPDVGTYIVATGDADFRDTIQTLLKRNKRVILWGFRAVGSIKSNMSGIFREMETWQNLTIEYLDDILPQGQVPKQQLAS